jgi:uncharacterized membrane protein SirB2
MHKAKPRKSNQKGKNHTAMYMILKHLHLTAVTLSFTLFLLRGYWMLIGSGWLRKRPIRIIPHLVDTILLLSAIGLAVTLQQYPFVNDWLSAKLLALVVYIVLGIIALKRGRSKGTRALAFGAALTTFGYIVWVALTRDPTPWQ